MLNISTQIPIYFIFLLVLILFRFFLLFHKNLRRLANKNGEVVINQKYKMKIHTEEKEEEFDFSLF